MQALQVKTKKTATAYKSITSFSLFHNISCLFLYKILFSRPLDSRFLLPVVSYPQNENIRSIICAWEAGADCMLCQESQKRVFVSFTIRKSNPLFCVYVLQSAKCEVSSLSTVFDAVTGQSYLAQGA